MPDFPRAQVVPQPGGQLSFRVDERERLRYHCDPGEPKPYFYPVVGPSGRPVTRLGHPHDPHSHRHHLSLWIGHHSVNAANFWEHRGAGFPACAGPVDRQHSPRIAHDRVIRLEDGVTAEAVVAARWLAEPARPLLLDERSWKLEPLYETARTGDLPEFFLDLRLQLAAADRPVELGKTPFGLLAVRVAKTMGVNDGGGRITNSEGKLNEEQVHWQRARWCDYSGINAPGGVVNGIAVFDHPLNPRHPTHFHVRDDGWMGASLTYSDPLRIAQEQPLVLRYRIWVHDGPCSLRETEAHWNVWSHSADTPAGDGLR